jgi:hypothetical protein
MAKGGQTPTDPTSPRMREAWKLKDAGDVVAARRLATWILAHEPGPEDAAQARELLRRATPPPALFGFAALAAFLLVLLVGLAATRY